MRQQIGHYFVHCGYPLLLWKFLQNKQTSNKCTMKISTTEKKNVLLMSKFVPQPFFTVLLATTEVGSQGKYVPKYILQWLFWIQLPIWLCQADQHSKHLINKTFFGLFAKKKYKTYLWRMPLKKYYMPPNHMPCKASCLVSSLSLPHRQFCFLGVLFSKSCLLKSGCQQPWVSPDIFVVVFLSLTPVGTESSLSLGGKAWAFLGNKCWIYWCKSRWSFIMASWARHIFLAAFF